MLKEGAIMLLRAWRLASAIAVMGVGQMWANDTVFLQGQVKLADGAAPKKEAEIRLVCGKIDSRQVMAGKNGKYFLKVERDDFNHVVRLVSTNTTEFSDGTLATAGCSVTAVLEGYRSSSIDLGSYVIGKDLKLPGLTLTAK
jgi:hypothetical protein